MANSHRGLGVVKELKERSASLPEASQCKVPGENAIRFYGLACEISRTALKSLL